MAIFSYTTETMYAECDMKLFVSHYVDVPRFLECCRQCPNYDKKWSCPNFNFEQNEYWKQFDYIKLFGVKMTLDPSMHGMKYEGDVFYFVKSMIAAEKGRLMQQLWLMEKEIPGSRSLFAGDCQLCAACAKLEGKPCRNPKLMRYSLESIGGNVQAVTEELLGTKILWVKKDNTVPEYFTLVSALLMK